MTASKQTIEWAIEQVRSTPPLNLERSALSEIPSNQESRALQLVQGLLNQGIAGSRALSGVDKLSEEYASDRRYRDTDERVEALIKWETTKNFTSGFVTGLGGLLTLPVSIPAALAASWLIQARLCATIAHLYGHDINEDRVRTLILMAMVGDAGKTILRETGINLGKHLTAAAIQQVPGRALVEINKRVGFRLLTKAGQTGVVNLGKAIPLVGGLIGGTVDAATCVIVGRTARRIFGPGANAAQNSAKASVVSNVVTDTQDRAAVAILEPAILIRLNHTYKTDLPTHALYEATRGVWKVGPRRQRATLALAVHKGIVVEVYEIDGWQPADQHSYTTRTLTTEAVRGRWEFNGRVAAESRRAAYVGRSVAHYFRKGAQNPIAYINVK